MKKSVTIILTLIVALSFGCALTACKGKTPGSGSDTGKESVIDTGKESVSETDSTESGSTAETISEEVFATLKGRARFGGNYTYDHTVDEYDKEFTIVTVFGGENISVTESDAETGEVYYDYVYGKDNRKLTVINRTVDNGIVITTSNDLFEDYYNPFDKLSAGDFAKAGDNAFSLIDKTKAKAAATALTGWQESIATFTVTVKDGKAESVHIVTDKIYRIVDSEDYYVSTYDFTVSEHGTAAVDPFKLNPYPHNAAHDVLQAALNNAAAKPSYSVRHQGHEVGYVEPEGGETRPGYGDTDYRVYVTEDMVYDAYVGEEHGFKLINGYVYPFTYNDTTKEIVLTDPVGQDMSAYKAIFNGFKVELFTELEDNVYVPHSGAIAKIVAPYFAEGNEKTQYSYATDFRIELKDGELYKVIFTYKTYGIEETVTLTYDFETENDLSFLDFSKATKTSVLDDYIGQYKDENGHFCDVSKSGFVLDGEGIEITYYGKNEQGLNCFVGKWKGTVVSIFKMSSKQLMFQSDDLTVNYTLTSVETDDVTVPDEFKGVWQIDNDEENLHYKLVVQSRAVFLNGESLPLISYKETEGLAVKYGDSTLYVMDADEADGEKTLRVWIVDSKSNYIRFYLTFVSADVGIEIPKDYVGTYSDDDHKHTVIITDSAITVNGETFKPESYTVEDGFNGTLGSQKNYFIRFYEMAGTVDKDKIIVGTLSDNYVLKRVAAPKENYIGTWESDPEIKEYHYEVVFTETELFINGVSYDVVYDPTYGYKIDWNDPAKPYTAYILFYYNRYGNPMMVLYDDNDLMVNLFKKKATAVPAYMVGVWNGKNSRDDRAVELRIYENGNITLKSGDAEAEQFKATYTDDELTFVKDGKTWLITYANNEIVVFEAESFDATLTKTIGYIVPKGLYGHWKSTDGYEIEISENGIKFTVNGTTTTIAEAEIEDRKTVYYFTFTLDGVKYSGEYGTYNKDVMIMIYTDDSGKPTGAKQLSPIS
ncbi:MAG: hypothetical protein PUI31_07200 [Clostridia bacterium]|nr:hypothetical protein [Clostridia bacterium]